MFQLSMQLTCIRQKGTGINLCANKLFRLCMASAAFETHLGQSAPKHLIFSWGWLPQSSMWRGLWRLRKSQTVQMSGRYAPASLISKHILLRPKEATQFESTAGVQSLKALHESRPHPKALNMNAQEVAKHHECCDWTRLSCTGCSAN